jgi:hypothetical protein
MKDKIKAQLKTQFPGVNLSNQRLDEITARLSQKITEESEIEAKLTEYNDLFPFADLARQDDRLRTLEAQTKKPDPVPHPQPTPAPTDDTSAWAKALIDKVSQLESEKQQTSLQQQLKAKLPDIPETYLKRVGLPASLEELDAFAEGVKTDFTAFKQELINTQAGGGQPPQGAPTAKAVVDDIKAWAEKNNPKT